MRVRNVLWLSLGALLACGCTERKPAQPASGNGELPSTSSSSCPPRATAPSLMPGSRAEHMQLAFWLGRYSASELDAPLLSVDDIEAYNRGVGRQGDQPYSQQDLLRPLEGARLQQETSERLAYLRERLADGRYVDRNDKPLPANALVAFDAKTVEPHPTLRVALSIVPIRCGPFPDGLFEHKAGAPPSLTYDRNACSAAHEQEVVEVLASWPSGMLLVRTRYAIGWLDASAAAQLSPPLPEALQAAFVQGPRARADKAIELIDGEGRRYPLPKHASVPLLSDGKAWVAAADGFHQVPAPGLLATRRALTRRGLLTTAFSFLDSRYGFGDADRGRDCSRLLMDLFEAFDIALPRHSGWQALAGNFTVDLTGLSPEERLQAIDEAAKSGAVLLAFPGHIMLYLGKNEAGTPMALHALGEYVQPCPGGAGETVMDVQRTVVSDLSLGKKSSRNSLLERLTRLVVLGTKPPAPSLAARSEAHALAPAAPPATKECTDNTDARIFVSPAWAVAGQPWRLIATSSNPAASPALWVFGPDGTLLSPEAHKLGGPPFTLWARVTAPATGHYTAVLTDGATVLACRRVIAHKDPPAPQAPHAEGPAWAPRWAWEHDTLNLWAAFVEQLFDGAANDEQTWTNLHSLLRDPKRNLLYNHLGANEDDRIELVPDCADLPYSLRAYFAWKLRLPFGYRQCSRGRAGVPPRCGPLLTSAMAREDPDDVKAFIFFVNRHVRNGVHSATGRTHPEDSATDLYPVALNRASLPPGTAYADPYGHVMIVAKWFPQGRDPNAYGILIAAEAQPDGTIGRRRFFPGSFLFDPSTKDVGAGFKQFRPLVVAGEGTRPPRPAGKAVGGPPHREGRSAPASLAPTDLVALDNAALAESDVFPRFSMEQYEGSKDDFYEHMDRLINPAPLDPHARLKSLLDALEESVRRRVLSVDNGEKYFATGKRSPIAMPPGYEIFETEGAWEDFATPSRDMRLLIALDTVLAVPAQVAKYPERFKLTGAEQAKLASQELQKELERELATRTFSYTKSNGQAQTLSLKDVLARSAALEIAYNPNDCPELRWGAEQGSDEIKSCTRHAPSDQHERMLRYRPWFHARARPARGTAD